MSSSCCDCSCLTGAGSAVLDRLVHPSHARGGACNTCCLCTLQGYQNPSSTFFANFADGFLFFFRKTSDGKVNNLLNVILLFLSRRQPCRKTVHYLEKDWRFDQTYKSFLWQHTADFPDTNHSAVAALHHLSRLLPHVQ